MLVVRLGRPGTLPRSVAVNFIMSSFCPTLSMFFPFSNSHRDHEMSVNVPKCLNSSADAANMHACWVVFACSTLQYGAVNWNVAKLDLLVRHVF